MFDVGFYEDEEGEDFEDAYPFDEEELVVPPVIAEKAAETEKAHFAFEVKQATSTGAVEQEPVAPETTQGVAGEFKGFVSGIAGAVTQELIISEAVEQKPAVSETIAQEPITSEAVEHTHVAEPKQEVISTEPQNEGNRGTTPVYDTTFEAEPEPEAHSYDEGMVETTKRSNGVEYPFLFLETDILAQHKLIALQSMLRVRRDNPNDLIYSVYLKYNNQVMKVGNTDCFALRSILTSDVFKDFKKHIKLNEKTRVDGDMMYALCGFVN